MSAFEINIRKPPGWKIGDPQRVAIRSFGRALTRLARNGVVGEDDYLSADPEPLAFWLVDNWWRLRWESLRETDQADPSWRMAHELASVGGAIWPRATMWSEGGRIGLMTKADPTETIAPVRFLESALMFLPAEQWEAAIDAFLFEVSGDKSGATRDRESLSAHTARLASERSDPDIATWRRVEAKLGFDPDCAPDAVMTAVRNFYRFYGPQDVEEALQATQGERAPKALQKELDAVAASKVTIRPGEAIEAAGRVRWRANTSPWVVAEEVAAKVRGAAGLHLEPLRNKRLADVLGVRRSVFSPTETPMNSHSYGLRLATGKGDGSQRVTVRSRASRDRRFELVRALGDMIWTRSSRLGVATTMSTDRQRFQRAFAQSLLCPFSALMSYLGTEKPTDEDMNAAAEHFHVNIKMVKTTLVNKKVISSDNLDERLAAA